MQQAWSDVENLINEMRPHLLRANVPERQTTMPEGDAKRIHMKTYVKVFDWLHNLKLSDEYRGVLSIWNLLPEAIWTNYKTFGIKGHKEQILLEQAQAKLRKAWKQNRPSFFGRKIKDEQDTDQESAD